LKTDASPHLETAFARLLENPQDSQAWSTLVPELQGIMSQGISSFRRSSIDFAEVTQEALIRVTEAVESKQIMDAAHLRSFAVVAARRIAVDCVRRETLRSNTGKQMFATNAVEGYTINGEDAVIAKEVMARLLVSLTKPNQELLELFISGLGIDDIAQKLGISYGAAAVRLHRLKAQIQSSFEGV
jgi:RNA polymerase sigma factor (sigma-70 family)